MKSLEHYNLHKRLHTEVLKEKYGKIGLQVLYDDDYKREVLLLDEGSVARTYALTLKKSDWNNNKEMIAVNDAIKKGEGIGEAFKKRKFEIQKNILDVYIVNLPKWLQQSFRTRSKMAKARIMEFVVKKDTSIYNYGIVTEIYSPLFRKARINEADKLQINIPTSVLESFGFNKEEIWTSLEKKVIASNLAKLYISVVEGIKQELAISGLAL